MARNRPRAAASQATVRHAATVLCVTVMAVVGLAACTAAPPEVTVDDPELIEGRAIYGRSCASCHGGSGGGGVGRQLSDGAVIAAFPSIQDQIQFVAEGRNNMPAFGDRLTPEEQRAVARYIREILNQPG